MLSLLTSALSLAIVFAMAPSANATEIYQNEIVLVETAHRALLQNGDRVLKASEAFNFEWKAILFELDLVDLTVAPIRNLNASAAKRDVKTAMEKTITESVLLANAESAFNMAVPAIKSRREKLDELVAKESFLQVRYAEWQRLLDARLKLFSGRLAERKKINQAQFSALHEYKIKQWQAEAIQDREKFIAGVRLDTQIARLPKFFLRLHMRARMAILGDRIEEAKDLIAASAWLRGVLPPFFSDKVLPPYSVQSLTDTLENALKAEQTIINELDRAKERHGKLDPRSRGAFRLIASIFSDPSGPGDKSPWDNEVQDSQEVVNGETVMSFHQGELIIPGEKDVITPEAKIVNEEKNSGGAGIARFEGHDPKETIQVDSSAEIERGVENAILNSAQTETNSSGTATKVRALLSRAAPAISKSKKSAFQKLVNSVDRWVKTQNIFNDTAVITQDRLSQTAENLKTQSLELPALGVFGASSLSQSLPTLKTDTAAFSWDVLRSAVAASNRTSFGDLSQFLPLGPKLEPMDGEYLSKIVQDVTDELDAVAPAKRPFGGSSPDRLQSVKAKINAHARSGKQLRLDEVVPMVDQISRTLQRVSGISAPYLSEEARDTLRNISELLSSGVGVLAPGLGLPVTLYEIISGKNFTTGETLAPIDRIFGALQLITLRGPLSSLGTEVSTLQKTSTKTKSAFEEAEEKKRFEGVTSVKRYGAFDSGPLKALAPEAIAHFKSGVYWSIVADKPTRLYRVEYSPPKPGMPISHYWTNLPPVPAKNGSSAITVKIEVPAGTEIFEGEPSAMGNVAGFGIQVYLINPSPSWIIP